MVSLLYFLPLFYIAYISYDSKQINGDDSALDTENKRAEWEKAMIRFADWFFMLVKRSDLGQFGLLISVAVHVQIYLILLIMQWCAWHIRTITMKIKVLKEASEGTYQGLELQPTLDTTTT